MCMSVCVKERVCVCVCDHASVIDFQSLVPVFSALAQQTMIT